MTATAAKAKAGRRPATPLSWTDGSVEEGAGTDTASGVGAGGEDMGASVAGADAEGTGASVAGAGAAVGGATTGAGVGGVRTGGGVAGAWGAAAGVPAGACAMADTARRTSTESTAR
jgi:hypothetical protein